MSRKPWSAPLLALVTLVALVAVPAPALGTTQAEVDAACADSSDAYGTLKTARALRDTAQAEYVDLISEREQTAYLEARLRDQISDRESTTNEIRDRVVNRAIDVYMSGGTQITDLVFGAHTIDQLVAGQEFLEAVTANELSSADLLTVIRGEMETMRADLSDQASVLLILEEKADVLADILASSAEVAHETYDQLRGECKRLDDARQGELARARAIAAARKAGGAGGVGSVITPGFICPMAGSASSFSNDWGYPRSGGRTHKGTDIFAPKGQNVVAVASGTVLLTSGGLGGISIWLAADYGVDYYYAHLSGYASGISTGTRVSKGDLIAFNGSSGNARGGSPHVHFQLHPGGRSRSPVNPFPTLARACR